METLSKYKRVRTAWMAALRMHIVEAMTIHAQFNTRCHQRMQMTLLDCGVSVTSPYPVVVFWTWTDYLWQFNMLVFLASTCENYIEWIWQFDSFEGELQKENAVLTEHVTILQQEVASLKEELQQARWGVHCIEEKDDETRFYTGLPSFAVFMWLFK